MEEFTLASPIEDIEIDDENPLDEDYDELSLGRYDGIFQVIENNDDILLSDEIIDKCSYNVFNEKSDSDDECVINHVTEEDHDETNNV